MTGRAGRDWRPFQRDKVGDAGAWQREVAALRRGADASPQDRLHRLSRLGEQLRLHPDHVAEGVTVLEEALRLARRVGTPRARAVVQLRLAVALQYAGRHPEALHRFAQATRTVRAARLLRLRDFVEQHRGKCLAELGRVADARQAFRTALRLRTRRRRPAPGLVASTRRALAALPRSAAQGPNVKPTKRG